MSRLGPFFGHRLPTIQVGRTVRIPVDQLKVWMAERTTGAIAPDSQDGVEHITENIGQRLPR